MNKGIKFTSPMTTPEQSKIEFGKQVLTRNYEELSQVKTELIMITTSIQNKQPLEESRLAAIKPGDGSVQIRCNEVEQQCLLVILNPEFSTNTVIAHMVVILLEVLGAVKELLQHINALLVTGSIEPTPSHMVKEGLIIYYFVYFFVSFQKKKELLHLLQRLRRLQYDRLDRRR